VTSPLVSLQVCGAHPHHFYHSDGDRMKSAVKTKAKKTNNQASISGSLLKNNMEVEAAMEMQRHLDETGVHRVCTNYVL
jgi:hypothetical protein